MVSKPFRNVLLAFSILALAVARSPSAGLKEFVMPVVSPKAIPEIDGEVSRDEWARAVSLTGFSHFKTRQIGPRQAHAFFVADRKNLYFALVSPLSSKGGKPKAHKWNRDSLQEAFKDERIEISIVPPKSHKRGSFYLMASFSGSIYDHRLNPETAKEDKGWDAEWVLRQEVEGDKWHFELKVPLTDLGLPEGQPAGGIWKLNISRVWSGSKKNISGLNWDPHKGAEVRFIPGAPALHMEKLGDLCKGKLDLLFSINSSPATPEGKEISNPEELEITCVVRDHETGKTLVRENKTLALKDSGKAKIGIKKDFQPGSKNQLLLLVRDADGGTNYYFSSLDFSGSDGP
ncbi:MAG: hypothetical protein KGZ25_05690 [Planctomycetes bacterium]|nr:hypothetical protein [Planctomycetota bacterium]